MSDITPEEMLRLAYEHRCLGGLTGPLGTEMELALRSAADQIETLNAANATMRETLTKIANPEEWGYIDDSGCGKGAGSYRDSWLGEDHPIDLALRTLSPSNGDNK